MANPLTAREVQRTPKEPRDTNSSRPPTDLHAVYETEFEIRTGLVWIDSLSLLICIPSLDQ